MIGVISDRGGSGRGEDLGIGSPRETDRSRLAKEVLDVIPWKSLDVALTDLNRVSVEAVTSISRNNRQVAKVSYEIIYI